MQDARAGVWDLLDPSPVTGTLSWQPTSPLLGDRLLLATGTASLQPPPPQAAAPLTTTLAFLKGPHTFLGHQQGLGHPLVSPKERAGCPAHATRKDAALILRDNLL